MNLHHTSSPAATPLLPATLAVCLVSTWGAFGAGLTLSEPMNIGGEVRVDVAIEAAENESVAGLQFDVAFDDEAYSLARVDLGNAAYEADKDAVYTDAFPGQARVLVTGMNQEIISDGQVATLVFEPVGDGRATTLALERPIVSDPFGHPLHVDDVKHAEIGEARADQTADEAFDGSRAVEPREISQRHNDSDEFIGGNVGTGPNNPNSTPNDDQFIGGFLGLENSTGQTRGRKSGSMDDGAATNQRASSLDRRRRYPAPRTSTRFDGDAPSTRTRIEPSSPDRRGSASNKAPANAPMRMARAPEGAYPSSAGERNRSLHDDGPLLEPHQSTEFHEPDDRGPLNPMRPVIPKMGTAWPLLPACLVFVALLACRTVVIRRFDRPARIGTRRGEDRR